MCDGLVAQLVERGNGIAEVAGSNPVGSTIHHLPFLKFLQTFPDMSLMETVPPRFSKEVSLGDAIKAVVQAKEISNCRPRYVRSLRTYLSAFARGRENLPVGQLDVFSIETWFASRTEAASTMASNIGRLAALFSFCERRGWIQRNPTVFLEKPRLEQKSPKILSVEEAAKLIEFTRQHKPHALPYFTLALYAGIRPEELEKATWSDIDLDLGIVVVSAAASKVRKRRIVDLMPKAVALLRNGGRLPIGRQSRRRFLEWAGGCLGFGEWPQDILRHSAASYLLASHVDVAKVCRWLGNSPGVLLSKYTALVKREDAEKFWTL